MSLYSVQVNQLSMLISSLEEIKKLSHDNSVDFSLRLCLHKTWMNQNYILFIYGDDHIEKGCGN